MSKAKIHVGNIKLGPINTKHKYAEISYFIGDKKYHNLGIKSLTIKKVCQIAKNKHKIKVITRETFIEKNMIGKNDNVKILGRGELKTKIDVTADGFSKSAKEAIEKLGGKVEIFNKHEKKDA